MLLSQRLWFADQMTETDAPALDEIYDYQTCFLAMHLQFKSNDILALDARASDGNPHFCILCFLLFPN